MISEAQYSRTPWSNTKARRPLARRLGIFLSQQRRSLSSRKMHQRHPGVLAPQRQKQKTAALGGAHYSNRTTQSITPSPSNANESQRQPADVTGEAAGLALAQLARITAGDRLQSQPSDQFQDEDQVAHRGGGRERQRRVDGLLEKLHTGRNRSGG